MAKTTNKQSRCPRHWTLAQRLDHYTDKSGGPDACWPWAGARSKAGYGVLKWEGKVQSVHRLAWKQQHGPIPPEICVCHHCDNPPCRNEAHLFDGTKDDNNADMDRKGRARRSQGPKGERHGNAKLTDTDVRAIRSSALSLRALGRKYGVAHGAIAAIRRGEAWRHVL